MGQVRGKDRPRAVLRNGTINMYTTTETKNYEALIKHHLKTLENQFNTNPDIAVTVKITAFFRPLKSKKLHYALLKPDVDNVAKIVLDAMNGVCYADDKQVIDLHIAKVLDTNERIEVEITYIDEK